MVRLVDSSSAHYQKVLGSMQSIKNHKIINSYLIVFASVNVLLTDINVKIYNV